MSETAPNDAAATIDVKATLEDKNVSIENLLEIRRRTLEDEVMREAVEALLSDLPPTIEEAGRAQAQIRTKGFGYYALGEDRSAAKWLEKAGDDPRVRHVLGRSLLASGRFESAVEALAGLEKEEPESVAVLAESCLRAGDPDLAGKALKKLGKSERESADGRYLEGYWHEIQGEYDEAYTAYREVTETAPGHAKAMFRLAYCLDLDGHEDQAVEIYEQIRRQRPTFAHALVNLGVLYEDRGEYSKAIEVYRQILDVNPNHTRARRFLGDARASLNMYYDEDLERTEDRRAQILKIPISDFELSVRSRNCLAKMDIETLGDLIKKTEAELLSYKNFGETSLQEIKDILAQKGLRLGMGREEQTASIQSAARTLLGIEPEKGNALEKNIEDLELSVRSRNAMEVLGVSTLGDLTRLSEKDLAQVKNFGQTSMNEVKEKLAEYGLTLAENESEEE